MRIKFEDEDDTIILHPDPDVDLLGGVTLKWANGGEIYVCHAGQGDMNPPDGETWTNGYGIVASRHGDCVTFYSSPEVVKASKAMTLKYRAEEAEAEAEAGGVGCSSDTPRSH